MTYGHKNNKLAQSLYNLEVKCIFECAHKITIFYILLAYVSWYILGKETNSMNRIFFLAP